LLSTELSNLKAANQEKLKTLNHLNISKNQKKCQTCNGNDHLMQPIGKGTKRILTTQLSQQKQGKYASGKSQYWWKGLEDNQI
jgi:hypothetical protein